MLSLIVAILGLVLVIAGLTWITPALGVVALGVLLLRAAVLIDSKDSTS